MRRLYRSLQAWSSFSWSASLPATLPTTAEASFFLQKYNWNLDAVIDAYYEGSGSIQQDKVFVQIISAILWLTIALRPSGRDTDELAIDNTLEFCEDLDVNSGDVVLLAVTYQLKSPGVGAFPRTVGSKVGRGSIAIHSQEEGSIGSIE